MNLRASSVFAILKFTSISFYENNKHSAEIKRGLSVHLWIKKISRKLMFTYTVVLETNESEWCLNTNWSNPWGAARK